MGDQSELEYPNYTSTIMLERATGECRRKSFVRTTERDRNWKRYERTTRTRWIPCRSLTSIKTNYWIRTELLSTNYYRVVIPVVNFQIPLFFSFRRYEDRYLSESSSVKRLGINRESEDPVANQILLPERTFGYFFPFRSSIQLSWKKKRSVDFRRIICPIFCVNTEYHTYFFKKIKTSRKIYVFESLISICSCGSEFRMTLKYCLRHSRSLEKITVDTDIINWRSNSFENVRIDLNLCRSLSIANSRTSCEFCPDKFVRSADDRKKGFPNIPIICEFERNYVVVKDENQSFMYTRRDPRDI